MDTYLINVHSMNHFKSAKSVACAHLKSVCIAVFDRSLLNETLQWRWGVAGPESPPPKVRDETYWQAQVVRLNTFGASKSHLHPVVIHQHISWNASPSLNIVSVGVRLMHGSFSLVHAEGHCWLALQRHTHTPAWMSCTYISLYPAGDLLLLKNGN